MATRDAEIRAQVDEVFGVLALMGEALLPLGVFDDKHYPETLVEVEASLSGGGAPIILVAFQELKPHQQLTITAGLAFCTCFSPLPVYRGFGAAVRNDWEWGKPDTDTLSRKVMAKTGALLHLAKDKGPQENRAVLAAFDNIVQILQVKRVAFLSLRPSTSGFASEQPRYVPAKAKDVHKEVKLLQEWIKVVEKTGHPGCPGDKPSTWGMPFASWESKFSCQLLRSRGLPETLMMNQMDPGRLLHAFVCRNTLDLSATQMLVLPPHTPAESLACWLEGLPGMTHKIVTWGDLDTGAYDKKCSKSLQAQSGHFPLPEKVVVRSHDAAPVHRSSFPAAISRRNPTNASSPPPPPYANGPDDVVAGKRMEGSGRSSNMVELPADRGPVELQSTAVDQAKAAVVAERGKQLPRLVPTSNFVGEKHLPSAMSKGMRTLNDLRKKPSSLPPAHPPALVPGKQSNATSGVDDGKLGAAETPKDLTGSFGPTEANSVNPSTTHVLLSDRAQSKVADAVKTRDYIHDAKGPDLVAAVELPTGQEIDDTACTISPSKIEPKAVGPTPDGKQPTAAPECEEADAAEMHNASVPSIVVQEHVPTKPTSISKHAGPRPTEDHRTQSKLTSEDEPPLTPPRVAAEDDSYLELLTKVASGQISPQDLQRILAQRTGKETTSSGPAAAARPSTEEFASSIEINNAPRTPTAAEAV